MKKAPQWWEAFETSLHGAGTPEAVKTGTTMSSPYSQYMAPLRENQTFAVPAEGTTKWITTTKHTHKI